MIQNRREDNVKARKFSRLVLKSCSFGTENQTLPILCYHQFYVTIDFTLEFTLRQTKIYT
jgi:hypothetical protein